MEPSVRFHHERLIVYGKAIEAAVVLHRTAAALPAPDRHLADQLRRASASVVLNIAEGAGEFSRGEKRRFYRIACRSATECAAILDLSRRLHRADLSGTEEARRMLHECVRMLATLCREGRKRSVTGRPMDSAPS